MRFGSRLSISNDPELKKEVIEEAHYSSYSIHLETTKMYRDPYENLW